MKLITDNPTNPLYSEAKILVAGAPWAPWAIEWLELYKIPMDRLIFYDPCTVYYAEMVFAQTSIPLDLVPLEFSTHLRKEMDSAFPRPIGPTRPTAIFIHRPDNGGYRSVTNWDDMLAVSRPLLSPDYDVIDLRDETRMPLAEKIALFRRARLVVGPPGAGFTHMLFSARGTTIAPIIPYNEQLNWHNLGVDKCGFSLLDSEWTAMSEHLDFDYRAYLLNTTSSKSVEAVNITRWVEFLGTLPLLQAFPVRIKRRRKTRHGLENKLLLT
jgi:capsular polysaccharide biosynthesis protein